MLASLGLDQSTSCAGDRLKDAEIVHSLSGTAWMMDVEKMKNPENNTKVHVPAFAGFRAGMITQWLVYIMYKNTGRGPQTRSKIQSSAVKPSSDEGSDSPPTCPDLAPFSVSPKRRMEGGQS